MEEGFNVVQFFEDGQYEYVRRNVSAKEAGAAMAHYTRSMAVRMGMVKRVIITDELDQICFEWEYEKGITFPITDAIDPTKEPN